MNHFVPYSPVSPAGKESIMQGEFQGKCTVLYARLSDEDERAGTSLSIQNQEMMLRAHAQENHFTNILFLYDDGITGVKTKRPGFQKLLSMIQEDKVGILIVTDLSRLYRNQSEANYMMEILFPSMGIRFIALSERYDSKTNGPSEEDMAMFYNFINECYPRQISRKVNAVIQSRAKNGVRISTRPPYGYMKDPEDRLKIVPDPEAAKIVRYIFDLCISGLSPEQIAVRLEKEQVLVPAQYAFCKFGRSHSCRNPNRPYQWSDGTVAHILENEDYIGVQISCKTHRMSYKSDITLTVPEKDQYRVENAHEPIIDREVWDAVQSIRLHKRGQTKWEKWTSYLARYTALTAATPTISAAADCGRSPSISMCAAPTAPTRTSVRHTP